MYPETDTPPIEITEDIIREAEKIRPEPPQEKLNKLIALGVPRELAKEVLRDLRLDLIEKLILKHKDKIPPKTIASIFVVTLRGLRSEVPVENITDWHLERTIDLLAEGKIAKEAVEELLKYIANHPDTSVEEAVDKLGLKTVSREEAEKLIEKIIEENINIVRERGMKAMGLIMGRAMSILRGRIDGKIVAEIVRNKLKEKTSQNQ
jgi:glutamyl-tRNA(Gln) amidotransferase subunit E